MSDEWRDFVRKKTGRKRQEPPPRPQPKGEREQAKADSKKLARPDSRKTPRPGRKAAPPGSRKVDRSGSRKVPRPPKKADKPTGDLGQRIQDEARVVPLSKLKKSGTKFVRVISPETIVRIVGDSLENALAEHSFLLDEDERKLIAKEAKVGFAQLLVQHKKLQAERQELQGKLAEEVKARDAQQEELESQVTRLREQLDSDKTRLDRERERVEGIRISPESMDELERRLETCARGLVDDDKLGLPSEGDPVPGLATFREQFATTVTEVLREERKRFGASAESQEAIELLERRVAKLSRALEEKEGDLDILTGDEERAKESYYEASGGLSAEAKRFDWKAQVLKRSLLHTQEMLGQEISDSEREAPFPKKPNPKPKG